MNESSENTVKNLEAPKSFWIDSTPDTSYPALDKDINIDVAIIGGGITGITAAYLLKKEGIKVAIFEASKIVKSCTGFTTAKLTSQHHLIYNKLINSIGVEKAKKYADANEFAINFIENTIRENNIDCDFLRLPAYMYTTTEDYIVDIEEETEAAIRLGLKANYVKNIPLNLSIKAGLQFLDQAQFHPRKYLLPLAEKIPGDDCFIYENTPIIDVKPDNPITLTAANGKKITAAKLIIASHFPCYDGLGFYFARLRPDMSYVLGTEINGNFPEGMYINAESPGRSLRSQKYGDKQLILVGGEGHKTAHGKSNHTHYESIKEFADSLFDVKSIPYQWCTEDYITVDSIPYIGKLTSSKENVYVATGYGKWGMTNGTVAAIILKDMILNKENPWQEVFDPSRSLTAGAYKKLFTENFDVAKELILSKLKSGEYEIALHNGEGKILELEGGKYGGYRDLNGALHIVDITCTHMGCELKWNDAEKTWDCPCHGSRFNYDGEIIEGPALHKLNYYKTEKNIIDPNIK